MKQSKLILMLLKSIEIPLFLQDEYKEYHQSIDELITKLSASLQRNIDAETTRG